MGVLLDLDTARAEKAEQAFRDRWSPRYTATDLASELAPIPWVCEALAIAPGAVTLVGGAGFGGKTLTMQSFLLSVAAGTKAWGFYDVTPGRVVHVDYEQGRHLTQRRYQRLARSMKIDLRNLEGRIELFTLVAAHLDDDGAKEDLMRILDGAKIAIVDAFRGAFPKAQENDSGVRAHLDMLQKVSEKTGCTIVTIAHSRKLTDDKDIRSSLRGSGALFDAAQTVYMLDARPGRMTRVTCTKERVEGDTKEPFGLRIKDEVHPDPSVVDRKWGLIVEYAAPCEVQAEYMADEANDDITVAMNAARLSTVGMRALSWLQSYPDGLTEDALRALGQGLGTSRDLSAALSELVKQGNAYTEGRGRSTIYRLSREPGED